MSLKQFEQLDAKFERLLSDLERKVDRSEFTKVRKLERRALADTSDLEFCRIYFPQVFDLEFNDVHRHIASLHSGNFSISGFPMSGKTAFAFISKIVKPIAMGESGLFNVTLRTEDIAKERTSHIARMLKRNRLLNYDYKIKLHQDQKGYYLINNATLVASSVKTGLRNLIDDNFSRFKVAIGDDLYNRVSVSSKKDNKNVVDFITGELFRQMEPDGLCIVLGNRITDDCPIVKVQELFPENHFSFPIKDAQDRSNWEAKHPTESLPELEAKTKYEVWQGEWMDQPCEVGDTFDLEWLRQINVNTLTIIATVTAIDPQHGVSPASCNKGIITVSSTDKQKVIVEDIWITKEGYYKVFDYVNELRRTFPVWKAFLFEDDFNQWGFAKPYYQRWVEDRKDILPIIKHSSKDVNTGGGSDKDSRILSLVHPHQTAMILYSDKIWENREFIKFRAQYLAYGRSTKVKPDALDAMATAYHKVFTYIESGSFKPSKQRTFKDKVFGMMKF